jgi:HAE1 family hydrophobic/amphiphilic exporter-1
VLRERLKQVAGITVTHVGLLDAVGGNKQIEFSLQGPDLRELERLARLVMDRVRNIPGLVDLDSSVKPDKPTVDIVVRRDAASDLGLSVAQIAASLRTLVAGQTVGNWRAPDDQTYDVNVRLAPDARVAPQDLDRVPFATGQQRRRQPAHRAPEPGGHRARKHRPEPDQPARPDARGGDQRQRLRPRGRRGVGRHPQGAGRRSSFPPGYRYQFSGSAKNMAESFGYAVSALAMAVIFIYMILASQFKSFLQPLALMTSLPLTLIGVVLALLFCSAPRCRCSPSSAS